MTLSKQTAEVSQNCLDQDLKHITFYHMTYLNKHLWFRLKKC